jgi:fused signal recognition particle receptor
VLLVLSSSIVAVGAYLYRRGAPEMGVAPSAVPAAAPPARASWLGGLAKTRGSLAHRILQAWRGPAQGDAWLNEVEEILLSADVGVKATQTLLAQLRARLTGIESADALRAVVRSAVRDLMAGEAAPVPEQAKPLVVLVVGVNGVGKTTTIGKLAHRYRTQGRKVLMVAGDTFRAAAIEQLGMWAERADVGLVKHQSGADPSAVAFDGVQAALARAMDVVLIDTAGRLHVKSNLMEEVKKVARTIGRQVPGAPHEVLLVIDATTGQNALNQARAFHEALGVTGVALTKLDGTAKGGIALAIRRDLQLPIRYVGLGERIEDLAPFDAEAFAAALFADDDAPNAA